MLAFEYFNPENFKAVLEYNTYGAPFLAEIPHVFEGNNQYASGIFFRYRHRVDNPEEKIGLKLKISVKILLNFWRCIVSM